MKTKTFDYTRINECRKNTWVCEWAEYIQEYDFVVNVTF